MDCWSTPESGWCRWRRSSRSAPTTSRALARVLHPRTAARNKVANLVGSVEEEIFLPRKVLEDGDAGHARGLPDLCRGDVAKSALGEEL